ncbi:MAG: ABC transporter substrate-binding protein [Infirmifilum sp.]|uniref:ABC transporter substrate-binding protein n=1 Tax=Infirmifilum sp. TaxID=2856575 RepID=UPI003C9E1749
MRLRVLILVAIIAIFIGLFIYAYIEYLRLKEIYEKSFLTVLTGEHISIATDLSLSFTSNLRFWLLVKPPIYPAWAYPPPPAKEIGISNITFVRLSTLTSGNRSVDGLMLIQPDSIHYLREHASMLSVLNKTIINRVPPVFVDRNGKYVTVAFRVNSIIVNKKMLNELGLPEINSLSNIYDFFTANPSEAIKLTIIMPKPSANTPTQYLLSKTLEIHGWERGLQILIVLAGLSTVTERANDAAAQVALGIYPLTIGNNDNAFSAYILSGGDADLMFIKETNYEPLTLAALETGKKVYVEKLILWFLSRDGQKSFLTYTDYIPVNFSDTNASNHKIDYLSSTIKYLGNQEIFNYSLKPETQNYSSLALQLYEKVFLEEEVQASLKKLFQKIAQENNPIKAQEVIQSLSNHIKVQDPWSGSLVELNPEYLAQVQARLSRMNPSEASSYFDKLQNSLRQWIMGKISTFLSESP